MKRTSYQLGSVVCRPRKRGPDAWIFRYMEDGVQKAEHLGTIHQFKTKAAARKEADRRRTEINERIDGIMVSGLCDRLKLEWEKAGELRPHSIDTYKSFLKRVRLEWGGWRVDDFAKGFGAVEAWVNDFHTLGTPDRVIPDRTAKGKIIPGRTVLGQPPRPASKKTKLHMKAFLHLLIENAMRWNLLPLQRNPITLLKVKGRKKKVRPANIITRDQWIALTTDPELCSHVRTMIFIAMLLGLRASEILGLRWEDFDMERKVRRVLSIQRSHVGKYTGETKTEGSEEELPIHEDLFVVIDAWRKEQTEEGEPAPVSGWLFANLITGRPFWRGTLQRRHLIPAGQQVGIANLGWHDFRHTYRAMMDEEKVSLDEQRTLMRHEDIRTTLGYGGKSKSDTVRGANAKVVEMLRKRA
jgi:integrase